MNYTESSLKTDEKGLSITLSKDYLSTMHQVVKNIIEIRKKDRVSQEEIANSYGLTQNAVSRLERGDRKVDLDFLCHI
jgi:DNA-binding transcriptional regulator YiaG